MEGILFFVFVLFCFILAALEVQTPDLSMLNDRDLLLS